MKETERDDAKKREGWNWRDRGALQLERREGVGEHKVGGVAGGNGDSGSFSFVSRRNKGISDDKCQACTRSTGSASKESSRRVGIKEDVGRLGVHPLSYKELPVKNNTMLYALHRDRADRPDSANYRFLRGRSAKRGGCEPSYSGTYLTVNEVGPSTPCIQPAVLNCR